MSAPNQQQIEFWNGRAGAKWVALQRHLDAMLAHVTSALQARVGSVTGLRVLDVGCGTGETCALWLAGGAHLTGVDISAPMLALAAERTRGAGTLVQADAAVWRAAAPFDLVVSRFGVMFFDAPDAAFANLAANLRPGGRLVFACWRAPRENPWAMVPLGAIRDLLPDDPPPDPHAPGPFALADQARLAGILDRAGFVSTTIEPVDFAAVLAGEGGAPAAARFVVEIGPAARALVEASDETRALAARRIEAALAAHDRDGAIELGGAIWLVQAVRA